MEVKVKFNDINVKEEKEKTLVKVLMLKGEKGERGDGDFNVIEDVKVNGTSLPVLNKSVNVEIPTNNSAFNNDSGYLVENDMQMTTTSDIQNGSQITDGTGYGRLNKIYGDTEQNGTPTPDTPVDIDVVTGDVEITISNSDNTSSQNFLLSLGDIELCKIGNYQDYIYYEDGKWYLEKNVGKETNDGNIDEKWGKLNREINGYYGFRHNGSYSEILLCDKLTNYTTTQLYNGIGEGIGFSNTGSYLAVYIKSERVNSYDVTDLRTFLANNPITYYYQLSTPQEIEITNEILINQLEQTLNLYKNETNFTISASNAVPSLNITYSITNRDFYSKEEADSKLNIKAKELKNNEDNILKEIEDMKNTLKFHIVANSQATYVAEFDNGKKLLVDTGMPESWNDIKTAIDNLGITKFDYFIITHAHYDHTSNIQNFLNNYDFSDCVCWVGLKPDYVNHSDVIIDDESIYDNMITLLQTNGLNPIVPENDNYYNIDENTKLHFLNTDTDIAENYYNANIIPEYQTNPGVNFNHFSLITEIIYKKDVINLPGDIERINEQYYYPYVHKASFLALPHHGINRDYYKQFYYATMPKFAYGSWVIDNNDWSKYDHRQFNFVKELNTKMITPTNSIPVNGLHTFISNGYSLISTSLSSGLNYPGIEKGRFYSDIDEIINFTIKTHRYVTINDLFNNMNFGDILFTPWLPFLSTHYEQLYNELKLLFPDFDNLLTNKLDIEFRKTKEDIKEIKIYNKKIEYVAQSRGENTAWSLNNGNGIIDETIIGIDNLITRLKQLPFGHYTLKNYQDDVGDVLSTSIRYALTFDIFEKWVVGSDNVIIANIYGTMRSTDTPTENDKARAVIGFINTSLQQKYIWFKVN